MPARARPSRSLRARALADLELLGQLGRGDPAPGLEDQEGGDEPVLRHRPVARKVAKEMASFGRTMVLPEPHDKSWVGARQERRDAMPGLVAPLVDEREVLLGFLGQQRDALRYAAHGLTRTSLLQFDGQRIDAWSGS